MGVKEEQTGNVLPGAPILGEPWWLLSRTDGTAFCCHVAPSWFAAREVGRVLAAEEDVAVELIFRSVR